VLNRHDAFTLAVRNIARWGDTDVFPFPPENHILHDRQAEVVQLLEQVSRNFGGAISENSPVSEGALSMVTYEGFRWVTQIDPLWNAYFLGLVLRLAPELEQSRISVDKETVFSYRLNIDQDKASLFSDGSWNAFIDRSDELAHSNEFVVTADIADFYGRLYHHRIENALQLLKTDAAEVKQIDTLLRHFSGGPSYGLPVGGPAARLLSESALIRVDRLLQIEGIHFCRYADDYRLFAQSREEAFRYLVFLTESLQRHEGLTLQKQKTRVLRTKDYLRSPLFLPEDSDELTAAERRERRFLRLSLRYDPYSPTAEEDYERLAADLQEFDIVQMLSDEVAKSRINVAVVRRLATAIQLLDHRIQNAAVGTILKSLEMLAPALPVVLRVLSSLFPKLSEAMRVSVAAELRRRILNEEYFLTVPVNLAYALRVLKHENSEENIALAANLFSASPPFIQRDIVYMMYGWGVMDWIADKRRQWSNQHLWVQRAIVLASYGLGDEGSHWRRRVSLHGFELVARDWMADRVQSGQTEIPV
jgi:Reverse transcriptase (RNA-dependent DNA polymerase)